MSDVLALGLIEQLANSGLKIPANVSVVGFDEIPESVLVQPPPNDRSPGTHGEGLIAGRKLIDLIFDRAVRDQPVIPEALLIVRQSTMLRPKRLSTRDPDVVVQRVKGAIQVFVCANGLLLKQ
jgi:LacI family transcriptional regulator